MLIIGIYFYVFRGSDCLKIITSTLKANELYIQLITTKFNKEHLVSNAEIIAYSTNYSLKKHNAWKLIDEISHCFSLIVTTSSLLKLLGSLRLIRFGFHCF